MEKEVKDRLLKIAIPTIVLVIVLYGGIFLVMKRVDQNLALCVAVDKVAASSMNEASCYWVSINSLTMIAYVGLLVLPILALVIFLIFSIRSRLKKVELELLELKKGSNA